MKEKIRNFNFKTVLWGGEIDLDLFPTNPARMNKTLFVSDLTDHSSD